MLKLFQEYSNMNTWILLENISDMIIQHFKKPCNICCKLTNKNLVVSGCNLFPEPKISFFLFRSEGFDIHLDQSEYRTKAVNWGLFKTINYRFPFYCCPSWWCWWFHCSIFKWLCNSKWQWFHCIKKTYRTNKSLLMRIIIHVNGAEQMLSVFHGV